MPGKIFNLSEKLIKTCFRLVFFLVPLVLSPWNFELFEFNKMILVYILTSFILAAWLIKMIAAKKIIFRRSFWDFPLIVFLASQTLSTLYSLNPHTSVWGYYTRAHGGLASTLCYLILYWALVSNFKKPDIRLALKSLSIGSFLVAGYGILEHFGIDKNYWAQDVQSRVFSTLGQPNWLAAYLAGLIFIPIAGILNRPKTKKPFFVIHLSLFIILFLCLLYTKSRSGLIAFGLSYLIFWFFAFILPIRATGTKKKLLFKNFFLLSLVILALTLGTENPIREKILAKIGWFVPAELAPWVQISKSSDIRKIVWQGSIDIWRHYPLLGSGVETFAYSYYNFRPLEHNLVSEWDFLYNKAHNEYLNFLATTGIIGLSSYLFLILSFLFRELKAIWGSLSNKNNSKDSNPPSIIRLSLLAGFFSLLITNFFGFSVVATGLIFFLFPGFSFILSQPEIKTKIKTAAEFRQRQLALALLVAGFAFYSLRFSFRIWYADFLLAKADKFYANGNLQTSFEFARKAVLTNWPEPTHHNQLALTSAALAQIAFSQDEATLSAELAETAVRESNLAINLNPFHLNFLKSRAELFLRLAEINPDYKLEALESLTAAARLAPTDAKIFYNLALLYGQMEQREAAIRTLRETIEMKANYKQARFALALYLYENNQAREALEQLEYISEKIDPTDESIKKLSEDWQKNLIF
ncbi:MAG: O-antigen ligase family protein [Candidatus Pacebacteria bacterium]|nr:O-antigen ligase family protein [Candidatus Paceibacterota bacterium]